MTRLSSISVRLRSILHRLRHTPLLLVVGGIFALGLAGAAFAYFTSGGSGSGTATTGSLTAPKPVATTPTAGQAQIAWSAVRLNPDVPSLDSTVTYTVNASSDGGATWTAAGGSCAGVLSSSTLSCDDSPTPGTYEYQVVASFNSWTSTGTTGSVTVVSPAATHFVLTGSTSMTAGSTNDLTITAEISTNTTATSYTGSHNLTFSGASTIDSFNPTVTDASGTAINFGTAESITFTNGVATVTGSDNGVMVLYKAETANVVASDGTISNSASPLLVTVSSTGTATQFALSGTASMTAGSSNSLTITAEDTYGNTEPSYTGSKSLTFSGASTIGSYLPTVTNASASATNFTSAESINFAAGVASPTTSGAIGQAVMVLYKVETANVVVTQGTINNTSPFQVMVTPAAATHLSVSGYPASTVAGVSHAFTVTALDPYGNADTNYAGRVGLTATNDASAVLPSNSALTSGTKSFNATFETVAGGTKTLTATDTVTNTITGAESSITVTPAATTHLSVSGYPTSTVAGASHNFTVTALDPFNNIDTNYAGTVHFIATNDAAAVLPVDSTLTSGTGTFSATFKTVAGGTKTLTATDTVTNTITGSESSITVTYGTASQIVMSGSTTNLASGSTRVVTATIEDAAGNTVTGGTDATASVTFSKASGTGSVTGLTSSAAVGGVATDTVTGNLVGTVNIQGAATLNSTPVTSGNTLSFTVTYGTASQLLVTPSTSTPNAGSQFTVTLTAEDAAGNTVTNYGGGSPVTVTWSGATTSPAGNTPSYPATSVSFTNGVSTTTLDAKLYAAGTNTLTATASPVAGSASITVKALSPTVMAFVNCSVPSGNTTCTRQPLAVGNQSSTTFSIQTQDQYGNPSAPSSPVSITFSNSDSTFTISAGSPATITSPATTSGSVTLHHANNGGTDTLTATDTTSQFSAVTLTAKK